MITLWKVNTVDTLHYQHKRREFEPHSCRGVLDATLCDKVCQWLVTGRWFSQGTPVCSTNKTDHHDIAEILLKVALHTKKQNQTSWYLRCTSRPGTLIPPETPIYPTVFTKISCLKKHCLCWASICRKLFYFLKWTGFTTTTKHNIENVGLGQSQSHHHFIEN